MNAILLNYTKKYSQPFLLLCLELFFIVFSIHIKGFSGLLTLRNLAMGGVIAVYVFLFGSKKPPVPSIQTIDNSWIIGMSAMLLWSIILTIANGTPFYDSHSCFRSTINFFIMVVLLPLLLSKMEFKAERFAKALTVVTCVQALIVLGCFLSPAIKAIIFNIQEWDENFLYYRVSGLGIAGAGGTVYLFCGFLANVYYLMFYGKSVLYYATLFIIFFATMLVGRTGFYMEVVLLFYYFISFYRHSSQNGSFGKSFISLFLGVLVIGGAIVYVQSHMAVDYEMVGSSYRRLNDIFTGETVSEISQMAVPNISIGSILFGTGMEKGFSLDGVLIWNDSGYVQRFLAFGLLPAFLFYYILGKYLLRLNKRIMQKDKRRFWLLIILMMYIIEYKEAFIFYLSLPFVLILFLKMEVYAQGTAK